MLRSGAVTLAVAASLAVGGCAAQVSRPSPKLSLDPFYTKVLTVKGIPITSSDKVPDEALQVAARLTKGMLDHQPAIAKSMAKRGQRIAIMAPDEGTTDLPEQSDWRKPAPDDPRLTYCERKNYDQTIGAMTDKQYWDSRARGMGGLLTSAATENLIPVSGAKYFGETIFVHEFSHAILEDLEERDPAFFKRVDAAYNNAMKRGLWEGHYAETTVQEYWAEGTQYWFNSNIIGYVGDRTVLSSDDLREYDPELYELLGEIYGSRHQLKNDPFYNHPARIRPAGPLAAGTRDC